MALVYSEINEDISLLTSGLKRDDNKVASPLKAFLVVAKFPGLMFLTSVCIWCLAFLVFVLSGDNSGLGLSFYLDAASLFMSYGGWLSLLSTGLVGVFFVLMFYSGGIVYESIPKEIRMTSKLVSHVRANLKRISVAVWLVVSCLSVLGLTTGHLVLLHSVPVGLFVSIFIINGYISSETIRYGLGPIIKKLSI